MDTAILQCDESSSVRAPEGNRLIQDADAQWLVLNDLVCPRGGIPGIAYVGQVGVLLLKVLVDKSIAP